MTLLKRALVVILGGLAVFTFACLLTPAASRCDFKYRLAEVDCVKRGVDPFLVWNETVELAPYYSNNPNRNSRPEGSTQDVSVYVPWEYTLVLPFSFVDQNVLWWGYSVASFVGLGLMLWYFRKRDPLSALGATLVVVYPIWSNFQVGNYGVLTLLAAIALAEALDRKRDFLAGVAWMLLMFKPQIGLIFAVPILMRRNFRVGVLAVTLCLVLSVPAILLSRAKVPEVFFEPALATAFAFEGCGTWPKFMDQWISPSVGIFCGLSLGVVACWIMTRLIPKDSDSLTYLMPAAIVSSCWTYTQAYSHVMGWFVAFALIRALVTRPRDKLLWLLLVACLLILSRVFLAAHGFAQFFGTGFPLGEYAFRSIDSLNSTLALLLAAFTCFIQKNCDSSNRRGFDIMQQPS